VTREVVCEASEVCEEKCFVPREGCKEESFE